jgi:hypothetical protein
MTSNLDDWKKLFNEYNFKEDQELWKLKDELPEVYAQIKEAMQKKSLSNGQSR